MSETPTPPKEPRRPAKEFEDPQYHDEEQEIQNDERVPSRHLPLPQKPKIKLPPPRRRFVD